MEITKERFEDAGEKDEEGYYDYYYAGFYYRFSEGAEAFIIRQYEDKMEEVSFMSYCLKEKQGWKYFRFISIPYETALFHKVIRHLIKHEGVRLVKVLMMGEGYIEIDIKRASAIV